MIYRVFPMNYIEVLLVFITTPAPVYNPLHYML